MPLSACVLNFRRKNLLFSSKRLQEVTEETSFVVLIGNNELQLEDDDTLDPDFDDSDDSDDSDEEEALEEEFLELMALPPADRRYEHLPCPRLLTP